MLKEDKKFKNISWKIIESYFKDKYLNRLVRHQIESYNYFVEKQLFDTIKMFNPVKIHSEKEKEETGQYLIEIIINFSNLKILRPQIHENNGATKIMFPHEARLRNFTYSSQVVVDLNIKILRKSGKDFKKIETIFKNIPSIHIGKLPIMLKSNICVLKQFSHYNSDVTKECDHDPGGYFIISGSEKTILAQERAAENNVMCFNIKKNNNKWSWLAEIKSIPRDKCISPKQINVTISTRNYGNGHNIDISIPRIKQPIPIFILFRALGVISDKDITNYILLDNTSNELKQMLFGLKASIICASKYTTQEECFNYIVNYVMYTPIKMTKEMGELKKREFTKSVLDNDLFPHCPNKTEKIYFLGYMINKLLRTSFGWRKPDDRDSYSNKRLDLAGSLINNLFRNYFNKLVKDMQKQIIREINNGSWQSTDNVKNIINQTNIYKIIKSTTIENGIKRALATGDFGIKNTNSQKVGVAQVLNRLTYISTLSHLRRINTPIDKSGKLIPPRKLHNTQWGFICPAETPEGQSVGVVKNISYLAHITIKSEIDPILNILKDKIIKLDENITFEQLFDKVKVFVNGCWIGIAKKPTQLYKKLKYYKYTGIFNIYTSIIFNIKDKEIFICNDAGRLCRPLFKVKNNKLLINKKTEKYINSNCDWDELCVNHAMKESIIEYVDSAEQNNSLIAIKPSKLKSDEKIYYNFTHCEIHPSTIFGILGSCIPFPEHNQSPRNTYQCAMGKQAMGTYTTNFQERMDKTAYVQTYTMRPLVDTRLMNIIKLNQIPSGSMVIVAIMTYTGYNQEDSIIFNRGSIERGLFSATIYKTEKDEDKNIHGDEEIRCKADKTRTKGIKFANYDKLNENGIIPENTLIENRDIIIGKVVPIKENRNDPTKLMKYKDYSKIYRTSEPCFVDKNYINRNGDGYTFAKIRTRTYRIPNIGDKFCLKLTSYVLTNIGWIQLKDIDIKKHKVATLNNGTDLDYVYPVKKYEFDCVDDKLYHIKSQQINMLCTKNHKVYIQKRGRKKFEFVKAKDVFGKRVRYKKNANNIQKDIEFMEFRDKKYKMDNFLELLGSFIADGWVDEGKKHKRIAISMVKKRKQEFIKNTLDNLKIHYNMRNDRVLIGNTYKELVDYFKILSVGASNKYLPHFVWNLSQRQSIILMNSLIQGDGSYNNNGSAGYFTSSYKLANDIQKLSLHCGWSSTIKLYNGREKGRESIINGRTVISNYDNLSIRIIKSKNTPQVNHGHVHQQNIQVEEYIKYTGKVGCIEVPDTHLFYYKEDEFSPPCWTGNSSRHGQKGTIGLILPEKDIPFTAQGLKPDIIINPHCIPSRMTMAQLKETLLGKVLLELGLFGDGTSFGEYPIKDICENLQKLNYEKHGEEILYNGMTGEQLETSIFIGPVFYQRLKHMTADKVHSRNIGPMVVLTRQPQEGRSRDGGLRFGEMERDCMISHGAAGMVYDRTYECSDKFEVHICDYCGLIAIYNYKKNIYHCKTCDNFVSFSRVKIPYACKLLFQELTTMNAVPRIITNNSFK